jgi:hypothetical protein
MNEGQAVIGQSHPIAVIVQAGITKYGWSLSPGLAYGRKPLTLSSLEANIRP